MRIALLLTLVACNKDNPYYCADHPQHNCTIDAGETAMPCTTADQCTESAAPVCDPVSKTCVACAGTMTGACAGTTPVCSVTNTCIACTAHSQCASSNVCLPDGSCAQETQVAYVSAAGAGNTCSKTVPCPLLKDALAKNLPYVKIAADGAGKDTNTVTIDGKTVTILAEPGAKLDRDGDGSILEVRSANTDVKIYDLEITGASGVGADGIDVTPNGGTPKLALTRVRIAGNLGLGLSATAGALTIARSTIANNQGGGLSITGTTATFDIRSNVIVYNGGASGASLSQIGGAAVTSNTSGSKFELNTIAYNASDGSLYRGGATCTGAMVSALGNIVYRNTESDGAGGTKTDATTQNNASGCTWGNTMAIASDPGNLGFKSPITMPYDFHLTASSPTTVVNAAGNCAGTDFDGDPRPIGAACDLGADEYKP